MKKIFVVSLLVIIGVALLAVRQPQAETSTPVYFEPTVTPFMMDPNEQKVEACNQIAGSYAIYGSGEEYEIESYCQTLLEAEIVNYGWPNGEKLDCGQGSECTYAWKFSNSFLIAAKEQKIIKGLSGYQEGQIVNLSAMILIREQP
jgi:hypothetical protein